MPFPFAAFAGIQHGCSPDISVILVGGNDITARHAIGPSARRVGEAVGELVAAGSKVVVGTCPDLGIIKPVPQPLRSVLHTLSLRLAVAQGQQVRRAGGVPVSLAETLAPEFYAHGEHLFSADRFHPNSAGYELAAGLLLPAVCVALGVWDEAEAEASTEYDDTEFGDEAESPITGAIDLDDDGTPAEREDLVDDIEDAQTPAEADAIAEEAVDSQTEAHHAEEAEVTEEAKEAKQQGDDA